MKEKLPLILKSLRSGTSDYKDLIDDELLNYEGTTGSLLNTAARDGHIEAVMYFVEKGVDPNRQHEGYRNNSLEWAVSEGHYDIAEYLLGIGVELNQISPLADPVMSAASNGDLKMINLLHEHGADLSIVYSGFCDVFKVDYTNKSAINAANKNGHTDVVAFLNSVDSLE